MPDYTQEQIAQLLQEEMALNGNDIFRGAAVLASKILVPIQQILAPHKNNMDLGRSAVEHLPPNHWPQIRHDLIGEEQAYTAIKIHQPKLMIGKMSEAISKTIQFPVNTIFAHALGCVASAAVWNFTYKIDSSFRQESGSPINIFVCSSQPPSTGKSGVHKYLSQQSALSFKKTNTSRAMKQASTMKEIEELEARSKKDNALSEQNEMKLYELKLELPSLGQISPMISDATPEALEKAAIDHGGIVNVLSAEAESITVPIGGLYSDKGSNMGLILSLWDNEMVCVKRSSRVGFNGLVKGCFAVLAQDPAIDAILQAGLLGRGIAERFLLVKEPDMLGYRDPKQKIPMDQAIQSEYDGMIDNVINADETELVINHECYESILDKMCEYESEMKADGLFGNNMLRGFVGKADKQICKLACILHISEEWKLHGKRKKTVSAKHVGIAIEIFDQFKKGILDITENKGIAGDAALIKATYDALHYAKYENKHKSSKIELRKFTTLSPVCKASSVFKTTPNITDNLRENIIPALVALGVCAFDGKTIYINPNF